MRLGKCCTGAHQGSLGKRVALGLYSILALTVLIRRTPIVSSAWTSHLPILSDRNDVIGISPTQPQFKYKYMVSIHGASK